METSAPRVAILPSPGIGHFNPLLELARHLVAAYGMGATLFVIPTHASPRQWELLADPTLPSGLCVVVLPELDLSRAIPPGARAQTRISIIVRESLPALRTALLRAAARPGALVVDLFGTDAFDVADELGVPKYLYFTTSAWLLAQMMHLPALDRLVHGDFSKLQGGVPVPGCKPVAAGDLVDPLLLREDENYAWFLHHARRYSMARGILVNTWEGLEPATLLALRKEPALVSIPTPRVFAVGPLTKPPASRPSPQHPCLAWLDAQPAESVLFVAFGSRGTLSAEQTVELALGLEQIGQRFLWVARRSTGEQGESLGTYLPSVRDEDDVEGHMPEGFLERTRGRGLVAASWVPQVAVLSHPAVGAFLTHAGWNSSMEAIVQGVPMIAWPLYAEQRMNATMLSEDLEVAVRVQPRGANGKCPPAAGVVGREEVKRVVRLVMEGEEGKAMKERVRKLRRGAKKALEEGGSSLTALAEVVEEWGGLQELQPADPHMQGS